MGPQQLAGLPGRSLRTTYAYLASTSTKLFMAAALTLLSGCGQWEGKKTWGILPVSLNYGNSTVMERWEIDQAILFWNKATGKTVLTSCSSYDCDIDLIHAPASTLESPSYAGEAQAWTRGGFIIDCRIRINNERYTDLTTIMIHEIGHCLGLDHGPGIMRHQMPSWPYEAVDAYTADVFNTLYKNHLPVGDLWVHYFFVF